MKWALRMRVAAMVSVAATCPQSADWEMLYYVNNKYFENSCLHQTATVGVRATVEGRGLPLWRERAVSQRRDTMARSLFDPASLGALRLPNRIIMSSMSRYRSPGGVPTALNASYYAQRATAGLVVTELTAISARGVGWPNTPGIYTEAQIAGWRAVTDAVHRAGGHIFSQLWHCGRNSHPLTQPGGVLPVGPSAILPPGTIRTAEGRKPLPVPHELSADEIAGVVEEYRAAARNALVAGFDGIQVHAGNGFLLDQFLRESANRRTDGTAARRKTAVGSSWKWWRRSAKSGARSALACGSRPPIRQIYHLRDSDPAQLLATALKMLGELRVAYVDVVEGSTTTEPATHELDYPALRRNFAGLYVANNGFSSRAQAERVLASHADLISFGRLFIANPDLPRRLKIGARMNPLNQGELYSPDHRGYTDYPFLEQNNDQNNAIPAP